MTGIVLIGGRSSRFGSDKVVTPMGEKILIERVTDVIAPLFEDVFLIGHRREGLEAFNIVEDLIPGRGPLGGIYTALSVSETPHCFVFAADMPNLSRDLIEYMISVSDDHDAVVPVWSKGREPLHAVYHRRILPIIADLLQKNAFRIFDLLSGVDTLIIPEKTIRQFTDPAVTFANINTLADMQLAT
ncbi:MAG TPA: molybdenum cofactor guanylyltransferase [Desulfomonilia bacterium]|nr:molybdenum cofactor guanylyltransferase [Deltaproteobacteria bacterium]HPL86472.1 molybdenum cofactor guanylyltransferase [Deltaproteobacteria bacterium]HRR68232.1 molybdenum cofactor guanylyltransferase [Desulfomonilia bacterium]